MPSARAGKPGASRPAPAPSSPSAACCACANAAVRSVAVQRPDHGPDRVGPQRAGQHPERGEMAGTRRDDRPGDAELPGQQRGVQRARAAVGHEREVPRVVAAAQGDQPQRVAHLGHRVADHAPGHGARRRCPAGRPARPARAARRRCRASSCRRGSSRGRSGPRPGSRRSAWARRRPGRSRPARARRRRCAAPRAGRPRRRPRPPSRRRRRSLRSPRSAPAPGTPPKPASGRCGAGCPPAPGRRAPRRSWPWCRRCPGPARAGRRACAPSSAAAVTPATGPDSSRPIGAPAAWPNEHTPPFDRMTCSGPQTPADRSACSSEPR